MLYTFLSGVQTVLCCSFSNFYTLRFAMDYVQMIPVLKQGTTYDRVISIRTMYIATTALTYTINSLNKSIFTMIGCGSLLHLALCAITFTITLGNYHKAMRIANVLCIIHNIITKK